MERGRGKDIEAERERGDGEGEAEQASKKEREEASAQEIVSGEEAHGHVGETHSLNRRLVGRRKLESTKA